MLIGSINPFIYVHVMHYMIILPFNILQVHLEINHELYLYFLHEALAEKGKWAIDLVVLKIKEIKMG